MGGVPEPNRLLETLLLVTLAELISLGTGLRGGSSPVGGLIDMGLCMLFAQSRLVFSFFLVPILVFLLL